MPDAQQPLPGTTPEPAPAAAPQVDHAALATKAQQEAAAFQSSANKAQKELAALQKRIEDGSLVKEHLGKLLGLGQEDDPKAALELVTKARQDAEHQATTFRSKYERAVLTHAAQAALIKAGVHSDYVEDATALFDLSGVELDLDSGNIKDRDALHARAAEFLSRKPIFKGQTPSAAAPAPGLPPHRAPVAPSAPNATPVAPKPFDLKDAWNNLGSLRKHNEDRKRASA